MAFKKTISNECVGCVKDICGPNKEHRTCPIAKHSEDFQRIIAERNIKVPFICSDKNTGAALLVQNVLMPKEREVLAKIENGILYRRFNLGPLSIWI